MDAEELERELKNITLPSDIKSSELQRLKDKYFADIFIERLFSYLSPSSQKALCRSAVYGVPVTLDGLNAVSMESADDMQDFVRGWQERAFVYQDTETSKEPLWTIYGLLRSWLLDGLSADERKQAYKASGDFLFEMVKQNRFGELGLSWVDCMMYARSAYIQAQSLEPARNATDLISGFFVTCGFYDAVRLLNFELLGFEEHPSQMIWIARTYVDQGDYDSAKTLYERCMHAISNLDPHSKALAIYGLAVIDLKRDECKGALKKFKKARRIMKATGNTEGEAAILHQLATIDLRKRDFSSAHKKLTKVMEKMTEIGYPAGVAVTLHQFASIGLIDGNYEAVHDLLVNALKIQQTSGDIGGEAAAFHQLGILYWKMGRLQEGFRMVALSYLIVSSIGHEKAKIGLENLNAMASNLNYSPELIDTIIEEVAESYRHDRGQSLIDAAFPKARSPPVFL